MVAQLVTAGACICGICLSIPRSSFQTLREKRAIKLMWKKLMREKNLKTNLGEYYTIGSIKKISNGFQLRIITPIGFTNNELLELRELLSHVYGGNVEITCDLENTRDVHVYLTD